MEDREDEFILAVQFFFCFVFLAGVGSWEVCMKGLWC